MCCRPVAFSLALVALLALDIRQAAAMLPAGALDGRGCPAYKGGTIVRDTLP